MPDKRRRVYESVQQQRIPVKEPPSSETRHCAVVFDDGDPHLLGADDESEVQYTDFELDPSDALDQVIIH